MFARADLPSTASWTDKIIFGEYICSVLLCLGLSSMYHCFRSESPEAYKFWYGLDILGICILIASSFVICTWIAFREQILYFILYNSVVVGGLLFAIFLSKHPHFQAPKYDKMRALTMAGVVAFGVVPITHWVYNHYNAADENMPSALLPPVLMFGFYGIGFAIFYSHFPERFWPGRFDNIASSHQLVSL